MFRCVAACEKLLLDPVVRKAEPGEPSFRPCRSCIIGCSLTEDQFLGMDGVGLLLDLLRSSPRCVHSIILSILLDLCNNPNTRPLVLGWRDADGHTAPGVLLQLWREEEEELGVLRDENGGIIGQTETNPSGRTGFISKVICQVGCFVFALKIRRSHF